MHHSGTWLSAAALLLTAAWASAQTTPVQTAAANKPAAVVNGETIAQDDVRKLIERDTPPTHPIPESKKAEIWKIAVELLVDDALMRQFLAKNAPPVAPAELAKEMAELQEALAKQKLTLPQFLASTKQSQEQLQRDMVSRLQYKGYVTLRTPDQLLKPYYDANKVFFDKVFVQASHILMRYPDKADAAAKQAVQARMQQLRQLILDGKISFEQAAKTYSDCPSKEKSGDLGDIAYKFHVAEPFAKAAFGMQPGQISPLVETEFGVHIIRTGKRTAGEPSTFEKMRDLVREVYVQEQELYYGILAEQRKVSSIQINVP